VINPQWMQKVEILCSKVEEVVGNNDWPTKEGQDRADEPPSFISQLVIDIRKGMQ